MAGLADLTSTSLGYVIALVLPGFAALYASTLFTRSLGPIAHRFEISNVSLGLFLIVLAAAMTAGLVVSAIRWVVFEKFMPGRKKLSDTVFSGFDDPDKLATFRMLVDELYRYHQFFGGMALVFPFIACSFGLRHAADLAEWQLVLGSLVGLAVEATLIWVAIDSLNKCIIRQGNLLGTAPIAEETPTMPGIPAPAPAPAPAAPAAPAPSGPDNGVS